ncbi:MAG: HAMP domain-containing sensor histidine kinase [Burkholderiaceae bacterium]
MLEDSEHPEPPEALDISRYIGELSHELLNPLHAALGFVQLMATDSEHPMSRQQREQLARIESAGYEMLALIDDIRILSTVGAAPGRRKSAVVDMLAVLESAVEQARPLADVYNTALEIEAPDLDSLVLADPELLQRVVYNLLTNAIQYSRRNVRTDSTGIPAKVRLGIHRLRGRCRIFVSDNGPGLTRSQSLSLFEPFQRIRDTSAHVPGNGLGLAVCEALMYQMGGTISVWSSPGRGSSFEIELERIGVAPAASPTAAS